MLLGAGALTACATKTTAQPVTPRRDKLSGYALNTESWFIDLPFTKRFDAAARSGFSHVEFWFLNDTDRSAKTLAKVASDAGVSVAQMVGDAPELARSDTRTVFLDNCKRAVERAHILSTDIVTLTGHQSVDTISAADSLAAYTDHMAAAAPIFEDAQIFAAIEPFNPYDHPGHFIYGSKDAVEIVRTVGSPFLKLNYDLFHMQRAEGELIGNLRKAADTICYAQIADAPDRGQPGTGDVNYANVIAALRETGYARPIGLEFWAKDGDYDRAVLDMVALSDAVHAAG